MPDSTKAPATEALNTKDCDSIIPDFETVKRFLTRIDGAFNVKRGFNFVGEKGTATEGKPQEQFWTFTELKSKLQGLQLDGRAGFFFVNQSTTKGTTAKHITGLNTWVADVDFKSAKGYDKVTNPEPFTLEELLALLPVKPHLVVFTGHGYHLYFLAAPDTPIETRRDIQKRIASILSDFGADKASLHLLRMPGTFNRKENGWKPVKLVLEADHPRYTLEEMSAAFPELPKHEKKSVKPGKLPELTFEADLDTDGYTQQEVYEMTLHYVETAARGASDGNRHNTLNDLMPTICGRNLSYNQMLFCVTRFNELTGHETDEARKQLDDAIKANPGWIPNLPKRKKGLKRLNTRFKPLPNRLNELDTVRAEIKAKIGSILDAPTGKNHLIKVTVGVGKTQAVIQDLRGRLISPETWPKKPDGTDAQILVCVDTKEQAQAFKTELQRDLVFENDPPIYEGRNSKNCWEHSKIAGSSLPGKYCITCIHNPISLNYSGYCCPYQAKKIDVKPQKLIITPKAALLTDEVTEWGDILIIDEDLSQYLYQQEQYDEKRLRAYIELLTLHQGTGEAIDWINRLIADMQATPKNADRIPRYKMPELGPELIEQVEAFSGNELDDLTWKKADRFFSLLNGNYQLRITHSNILLTREAVNNALILDSKTVINLDATPRECLLKPLDFEVTSFETKQNLEYYQLRNAKLTKRDLQNETRRKAYLSYISALQARYGNDLVVFTHKAFADETRATGTETGEYRVHSRGLNKYKDKRIMVMLSSYRENVGSNRDIAKVMNVNPDTLYRETNDAEMLQTIGRLRGVNSAQKKHVVILSSEQLPLDAKASDLNMDGQGLRMEFFIPETRTIIREGQNESYNNSCMTSNGESNSPSQFQPNIDSVLAQNNVKACKLAVFIQECLDTLGFFHPELLTGGSHFKRLVSAPEMSKRTYSRQMSKAKKLLSLVPCKLSLSEHSMLSVYGSPEAARKHLLSNEAPLVAAPEKFEDAAQQKLFSLWWEHGRHEDANGLPQIPYAAPLPSDLATYAVQHEGLLTVHDVFLAASFNAP